MNTMMARTDQLPEKLSKLIRKRMLNSAVTKDERKWLREKTITSSDVFVLCIDDSSIDAAADPDSIGVNTIFTRGKCSYIAYRIHQLTGLPMAVWSATSGDSWTGHIAIQVVPGEYLDIEGTVTDDDITRRYAGIELGSPRIHETLIPVLDIMGDIPERWNELQPLERELINYLCEQLVEEFQLA